MSNKCCSKCSGYFPHRIGSHSDDYGGTSDAPCDCNVAKCNNHDCQCHKATPKGLKGGDNE